MTLRRLVASAAIVGLTVLAGCSSEGGRSADGTRTAAEQGRAVSDVRVSCETSQQPMYFIPRPTLTVAAKRGSSVRFEIFSGRTDQHDEQYWADNLVERKATGLAAADGGHATWTVSADLATPRLDLDSPGVPSEFSWRTRVEPADEWTAWRFFAVGLDIDPVRDCRVTPDDIYYASVYADAVHRDRGDLLTEYAHARRLREVFRTIKKRYPQEFTAAGDGHSSKRPEDYIDGDGEWIVFRGPVPPEAAQLLTEVAARPFDEGGADIEILDHRGYNAAQEKSRGRLAEAAAESVGEYVDANGVIDSRTGVLELEVTSPLNKREWDALRRRIFEGIAAKTGLRVVAADKQSRGDATTLPVRLKLGEPGEFGVG